MVGPILIVSVDLRRETKMARLLNLSAEQGLYDMFKDRAYTDGIATTHLGIHCLLINQKTGSSP